MGCDENFNELKAYFKERFFVSNYVVEKDGLEGKAWCWKDFSREKLTDQQKLQMKSILEERSVLLGLKKDKIIWCGSLKGNYLVKLGYNMMTETNNEAFISKDLCRNKDILPKAGAFAWLAYN